MVIVGASPFHAEFSFSNHCSDSSARFSSQCSPCDLNQFCTLSEPSASVSAAEIEIACACTGDTWTLHMTSRKAFTQTWSRHLQHDKGAVFVWIQMALIPSPRQHLTWRSNRHTTFFRSLPPQICQKWQCILPCHVQTTVTAKTHLAVEGLVQHLLIANVHVKFVFVKGHQYLKTVADAPHFFGAMRHHP